jgi:hypothetical protein
VLAGILSILGPVQKGLAGGASTTVWAAPGSQFQLLVGIFTSGIFMIWVGTRYPFKEARTNRFKVWCDFCGTMMLVLSVMLKVDKGANSAEGLSEDSLGILLVVFAVYPFFHECLLRILEHVHGSLDRRPSLHACLYLCRVLLRGGCCNFAGCRWTCRHVGKTIRQNCSPRGDSRGDSNPPEETSEETPEETPEQTPEEKYNLIDLWKLIDNTDGELDHVAINTLVDDSLVVQPIMCKVIRRFDDGDKPAKDRTTPVGDTMEKALASSAHCMNPMNAEDVLRPDATINPMMEVDD